jgi:long-subunit fatty acid transport protein
MDLNQKHVSVFTVILFFILSLMTVSDVQGSEVASTLNPVGSGARATGMGGAFIGVADDATAASWNPAGLVQLLSPEISVVYSYFQRNQEYSSSVSPSRDGENRMDADGLNYVSLVYPFILFDRNMVVSLNYQRLFEMDKDVAFLNPYPVAGITPLQTIEVKQEGFLYAVSPAFAVQVFPQLYVGAALNLWDNYVGKNGWEWTQTESFDELPLIAAEAITKKDVSFRGTNANFGFLWMVNDSFTLGGVYKMPFDANFKRKIVLTSIVTIPPTTTVNITESAEELTMKMPASYGLGLSYRHSDNWSIALDVYRTDWSKFLFRDEDGGAETNFITGDPISEGRLKDTTQVRLGTEYLFIREKDAIPVRFGIFYDPEPQTGHLDEYYGFTFGTGYARGRLVFDMSYQYRTGWDLTGDMSAFPGTDIDVIQHILMTSLIYYF